VSNKALPDLLAIGANRRGDTNRLDAAIGALEQGLCKTIAKGYPKVLAAAVVEKAGRSGVSVEPVAKQEEPTSDDDDKKRIKAKLKAKKKAKEKSDKVMQHRRMAEDSAQGARDRLNKSDDMKTSDMVQIAKSILNGHQQGLTSKDFFVEIRKRADARFKDNNLTREQRFARYCETDDGAILLKASRKAVQVPFDDEDDEVDGEKADNVNEAYRQLMDFAVQEQRQGETVEQAFARLHADPKYRNLVSIEKRLHQTTVAKAMGLG
jgi:hypothetical protein